MICLMVFSLTTPEDLSLPASLGSISERGKTWFTMQESFILKSFQYSSCSSHTFYNTAVQFRTASVKSWWCKHLLATINSFGMSVASFSFTASEMGPNITTGLLKPAEWHIKPDTNLITSKQEKVKYISGETAAWLVGCYFGYLHVRPPSRRRGIVWWLELRSGPLCSYASLSSLLPFDLSASRSLPCRCPMLPEQHSGRWPFALLCETKEKGASVSIMSNSNLFCFFL